jgi:hypothetical protein
VRFNPAALSTEASVTIANPMMKATTALPCLGMCSGRADADEESVLVREAIMVVVVAVAAASTSVVFIVYGVISAPSGSVVESMSSLERVYDRQH